LQEIYTGINKVDGKKYTTGIKFIFYGRSDPISFGRFDGTNFSRSVFKSSEQISAITGSGELTEEGGKYRSIIFFGKNGKRTEGWKDSNGKTWDSVIKVYSTLFPSSFVGKEVKIPDGHKIVGFALKKNA